MTIKMHPLILLFFCFSTTLFSGLESAASTFVGNGGSAGDIELFVAKKQVFDAFRVIERDASQVQWCECSPSFESHTVCTYLKQLSLEQSQYCSKTLEVLTSQILELLSTKSDIRYRFVHEPIYVKEGKRSRASDMIADRENREIIIHLKRFLEMTPAERRFLLAHEVLHFTQRKGQFMDDEGEIGPFTGTDGGRHLLNAMGAAIASLPGHPRYEYELSEHRPILNRSRGWKTRWFDFNIGTSSPNSESSQTFASDHFTTQQLSGRYMLGNLGFILSFKGAQSEKTVLSSVRVNEQKYAIGLGLAFRFFLFRDPMTFWGQSHALIQGLLQSMSSTIQVQDDFTSSKEKIEYWGGQATFDYYLPIAWGLWVFVGLGIEHQPHKYRNINVNYTSPFLTRHLGVSYGF